VAEPSQTQSVVVLDSQQELAAARAAAVLHGVELHEVPRRGIEPVTTLTLILVGTGAAVGAVVHVLEQRKGGQVVDLRPGAPKAFYRTPDVVFGTVVIVTVDGTVTVEVKEPEGMFGKVISTLPQLLFGGDDSTEQVTRAITEMYRDDIEIRSVKAAEPGGGQ
jgi:hypothetical protein